MSRRAMPPAAAPIAPMALLALLLRSIPGAAADGPLRVIVETDAGGDPDDEQSLVRFLLYACEWEIEGIIANRPRARDGENRNPERTGLGIVRRMIDAYGACRSKLVQHDPRYPTAESLRERAVAGYGEDGGAGGGGVKLILDAVDRDDPRPVWFLNWGTDNGSAPSSLKLALDRVLAERGPEGYARFKRRLRLSSDDQFGGHTAGIDPPFPLWIDTFRPPRQGKRWYHRFSALTATAGGFDIERDARTGHGPLGALYPLNTTHPQKEGDSMTFLYLVPTGMNDPGEPGWGSWAGRYGPRPDHPGKPYYWAGEEDELDGSRSRDNALRRWAEHLQNDFRARLDWCVKDRAEANHPPAPHIEGDPRRRAISGETVLLDAGASADPDGDSLSFQWIYYPECSNYNGPLPEIRGASSPRAALTAPGVKEAATLHIILIVTDAGLPPLARYRRVILTLAPPPGRSP